MLSPGPMSSAERIPSYLASQPCPGSWDTMRGATAATAGSQKCGSSRSSQPGRGTQSESRNATSGVLAAARPVLRAAPGPPFTVRRRYRAPAAAAAAATAAGVRRAVIHHDHRHVADSRQAPGQLGDPVADGYHHGDVTAGRASRGYGMCHADVEEAAREHLRGGPVRHRRAVPPRGRPWRQPPG